MNISKKIIFHLIFCLPLAGLSQSSLLWENLHCPYSYDPVRLYFDTTSNNLYMNSSISDSSRIAKWDGANWTTLPFTSCSGALNFINYNGQLLLGTPCPPFILKLNGSSWQSFQNAFPNGDVACFLQNGSNLYIGGVFDSIGTAQIRSIAKWDGTSWSNVGNFFYSSAWGIGYIHSLTFFMGELYAGGLFTDDNNNIINIAKWDGVSWSPVGGGIHGGMDDVIDLVVFNNELYAAGSFVQSHGNTGNYIQKWNGTNWSDVGGGVVGDFGGNGQIFDMEVYNNGLYVTGVFSLAGGIPAQQIAKWDGTNWCSLGDETRNTYYLTKSTSDLFVGGGFKLIDGDTTGSIVKWIGGNYVDTCGNTTGIAESAINSNLQIYPNPTTDHLTLELSTTETKNVFIEIKNVLGQILLMQKLLPSQKATIDISNLPPGIYFVELSTAKERISKKFIKQ